jgi:hypothetical protein
VASTALGHDSVSSGSSSTNIASPDAATPFRPVTRAQRGIHQPKVYTDDTMRYDKHAFLTNIGEPTSIGEAIVDKN